MRKLVSRAATRRLLTGLLAVPLAAALPGAAAAAAFYDSFEYADGPITNAQERPRSGTWDVTSGAMYARGRSAWTDSSVFRVITRRSDFRNAVVTFRLRNDRLTARSGASWHGAHVFLRYQSQYHLYVATYNRRDGGIVIKKKVPGGASNGGTYYTLASGSRRVPYGVWQTIRASALDQPDGSVRVDLYIDGRRVLSGVDRGVGGSPIRAPGKVGIRSDYDAIVFDDFHVGGPDELPPPPGGGGGSIELAKAPQKFLSPALADGVNDAATFGGEAEAVAVFDTEGREVYQAVSPGGGLEWDARDRSGRLVDSGVYVVRIRTRSGETVYQSIAVVK